MKTIMVLFIGIVLTSQVFASGDVIPIGFIKLQIMNFVVFVGFLFFLSKSRIAPLFKQIQIDYLNKSKEAQKKLDDVKNRRDSFLKKIQKLDKDFEKNILNAKKQAHIKYEAKILDVKKNIEKMNKDLQNQIEGLKRAQVNELKDLLMDKSIKGLKSDLNSKVDEELLQKLQNSFVQGVRA